MAAQRKGEPGREAGPVPRDMPDQQAGAGEDPWEAAQARPRGNDTAPADDVPDTDEAGTGPRGRPHPGTVHPEHPAPDEPSA
ncbi:hypothetical protein AB0L75_33520 [Streptomyces sp. NPDC052101]|uniref:hypothetical protein n=1 Tax=Streptomyces sp. NPDC052101 TaxID=3155763 RepID=UPI00341AD9DF